MKVAVPINNNQLSMQFGTCSHYDIFFIEDAVVKSKVSEVPQFSDVLELPYWALASGIDTIIAYQMGTTLLDEFVKHKVNVFVGVPIKPVSELISDFIEGRLASNGLVIR